MSRTLLMISVLGCLSACSESLYGTGVLYLYNGTDQPATVTVEGRTSAKASLRPQSGELLPNVIAGPYQLALAKGGAMGGIIGTEVVKERLTIVNVDAAACFARVDIAGLYSRKAAPAVLKQIYQGDTVFSIPEEIGVLPGERPPDTRPKTAYGLFRVGVIPCSLAKGNDFLIEDYFQKLK